ncbi:MAG TPA: nucleotidyltransferase domain-containing protein [Pirellulales bacterium]|nr:nucleotidyltransferase domain-containing protein [Pirellulales bacterium]
MGKATEQQLQELTRSLVKELNPVRVILFGSQARGTPNQNSDIDLLVVDSNRFSPARSRRRVIGQARRCLPRIGIPIDLLIFDQREYDKWKNSTNHVIAEALHDGRVLHERS